MNEALIARLKGFEETDGATGEAIDRIEVAFNRKLPDGLR